MNSLTKDSPFPRRFLAWMHERFPFPNALLFFSLYLTAVLLGQFIHHPGDVYLGLRELLGFFPVWFFFLLLRVYDEHKDFELDCQNYPERVLQSGLITLGHLKVAGALAIAIQLGGSLLLDGRFGPITITWLIVFAYSLLMAKEFFIGEWLEKRLPLYAFSHMIIMPMALIWMVQIGARGHALPFEIILLAGLSFLSGAAFEITRKLRAPQEERPNVDSYTKYFGTSGAPLIVAILLLSSAFMLAGLTTWVFGDLPGPGWLVALFALILPAFRALFQFAQNPAAQTRKPTEGMVALAMLGGYLFVTVAVLTSQSIHLGSAPL